MPDDHRPLGPPVPNWTPPPRPGTLPLEGAHVRLEPLSADAHAAEFFRAADGHDALFDYLFDAPFASAAGCHRWCKERESLPDPRFWALRDRASGRVGGLASHMRIDPAMGVIEVGNICITPIMQRSIAATEAMVLMMAWAFDAGYRRYEWKCNALNLPSRRAAVRLGFSFEGIFRNHMVVKGRSRDTAWFAVTRDDWPGLAEAYRAWLSPANFDAAGRQKERLSDLTRLVRVADDPAVLAAGASA